MWKQSVWSSSIAGSLASKFLKPAGLLTLTGAAPAIGATSGKCINRSATTNFYLCFIF